MNTLSYVLLCMLARKSCTGYELKQYMELFWQAHHSQIYTVLGKMETEGYVQFEADPDTTKKIYSLTKKGVQAVSEWVLEETAEPISRDEFLAKIYVIALMDKNTVAQLFNDRRRHYKKRATINKPKLEELEALQNDPTRKEEWRNSFGRYLIVKRRDDVCAQELAWCDWAEDLYHSSFDKI
ncbi:PadR family transcriptional regulator [Listeria newyorkensis]|uniref:PadR family transcriptional regulator n=1 Tax=Listeria newyorkensis TaxID=1497681 RepID=A0ABX4XR95_9LIST|nr:MULTISPECIES: PadR family transcriptional regulator [Listeria]KGL39172.1 PadR family transcriptional regulator [Listeriaceae bacterium FSL A5-0209]KGL43861.1 PadR family transcriptional regulator [Listeria newyorkensis]PNP95005.1 PadR family transcriptional regulator [Listeria newyorkensis]RQW66392.1 PadR family transcriptional regulator [Listeria sp. SHR_NRA_18]WAO21935.1 PadR family transcriptional regulator [Listeria newyorkensis]